MAFNYSRAAARFNKSFAENGETMTLERWENAGTPSRPNMVKTRSEPVTVLPFNRLQDDQTNQVRRLVQTAWIAPNAPFAPQTGDILMNNEDERFRVGPVETLKEQGIVVYYKADVGTA